MGDSENDLQAGLGLGLSVDLYSLNALSAFQLISEVQVILRKSLFLVIVEVEQCHGYHGNAPDPQEGPLNFSF